MKKLNKVNFNSLFSRNYLSWYLFFFLFILYHGINIFNFEEFSLLIEDPFSKLPVERQYRHQSPIQYFIGFFLFKIINSPSMCFVITQLIALFLFVYSIKLFSKKYLLELDYLLKVFVLSPGLLILLHYFGKPDLFLISSYLIFISTNKKSLIFISSVIMIFSHYQISIFYFLFSLVLRHIKYKKIYFISFLTSLVIFNFYILELGTFQSRFELYVSMLDSIILSSMTNLLLGVFSFFAWLWLPIISSKNLIDRKTVTIFLIAVTLACFGDFTRAGFLVLIPLYVYLITKNEFKKQVLSLVNQYPIKILAFIQFQKAYFGDIADVSWFWMNKEELKDLIKNFLTYIN